MTESMRFRGQEWLVSYAPFDVIETCVRIYQFTNCKLNIKTIVDGHWYFLEWEHGGVMFRYAVPSAVVAYCARRFTKLSPNDLRRPKFLAFGSTNKSLGYKEMSLKPECGMDCTGLTEFCACAESMHDQDSINADPGDVYTFERVEI